MKEERERRRGKEGVEKRPSGIVNAGQKGGGVGAGVLDRQKRRV